MSNEPEKNGSETVEIREPEAVLSESPAKEEKNDAPEYEFKYFKPIKRLALIFFLALILFMFFATIVLILLTKSTKELKVPDLLGKRFVDVSNSLINRGLRPDLKFVDVYDIEDGIILNQHPESGRIVEENSKVTLTISRSRFFVNVPNLTGSMLPIAINKLKNLHYQDKSVSISTGVISYIPSEKTAVNIVMDQSPKAGEKITPDVKVNLLVSSGPGAVTKIMPDVTGQSIDLCYDLLLAQGITIYEEVNKVSDINQSGIITAQSIAKNTPLKDGDNLTLKVNYYVLTEHPYSAYEYVEYVIPSGMEEGLFEAYIEDNHSRRIRYSSRAKAGQKISFVFQRVGNAKIYIPRDKKNISTLKINVDEF
jgi:serine/threonine-protein kinase